MNDNRWLFIGTDNRMSICSEIMAERGYTSQAIKTDSYTPELENMIVDFAPGHIVFPIHEMKGTIPLELLRKEVNLYTGVASAEWLSSFQQAGFEIQSYLKEELFIWKNAQLTAEAFLLTYYLNTKRMISGNQFHVAGFGRVGKMVADVLTSLGGIVTVIARSDEQLGEAEARGLKVERLDDDLVLSDSYLINTIPTKWLSLKNVSTFPIFDLASAPGCLIDTPAPEYYTLLPGLPGKYFPSDAAAALADALERIYRR